MMALHQELAERIRGEVSELEGLVRRVLRAWSKVQNASPEQEFYLDSVALNLHGFYSGMERLFELIARRIDQKLPSGEAWHRDLLEQMAQDFSGVRPAVISQESAIGLDKFRRFRHLVQNIYVTSLRADKMLDLATALPAIWTKLRDELLAFSDFLEDI